MTAPVGTHSRNRRTHLRIRLYTRAALFAVGTAFVITVLSASGADAVSGRLGGDFPAFYAAGSIISDGDWDHLYQPERQAEAQAALFPEADGGYLYFAYPPHAAVIYRPLAALDYRLAYAIHSVIMIGAVIWALALLRPMVGIVRRNFEQVVAATLLFYPMLRAVTGGQNTALSFLAMAAVWRLLDDDHDEAAGLVIALLLFKPQFAIPLIGLMMVARRWRAVAASMLGAVVVWGVGAVTMGAGWLPTWWREVSNFAVQDADVNANNAISWLGFAQGMLGSDSTAALFLAGPLMVATTLGLIWVWSDGRLDLATRMAVTMIGILLLSPHAMFYDVGLVAIAGVVVADRLGKQVAMILGAIWVFAWLQLGSDLVGFAPLFFVTAAAGLWLANELLRAPAPSPDPSNAS